VAFEKRSWIDLFPETSDTKSERAIKREKIERLLSVRRAVCDSCKQRGLTSYQFVWVSMCR
jgi:hypothetical protein